MGNPGCRFPAEDDSQVPLRPGEGRDEKGFPRTARGGCRKRDWLAGACRAHRQPWKPVLVDHGPEPPEARRKACGQDVPSLGEDGALLAGTQVEREQRLERVARVRGEIERPTVARKVRRRVEHWSLV